MTTNETTLGRAVRENEAAEASPRTYPCRGYVHVNSWAGRSKHRVEVLRRGPKRYTVRILEKAFRWSVGDIKYPPHSAVTLD